MLRVIRSLELYSCNIAPPERHRVFARRYCDAVSGQSSILLTFSRGCLQSREAQDSRRVKIFSSRINNNNNQMAFAEICTILSEGTGEALELSCYSRTSAMYALHCVGTPKCSLDFAGKANETATVSGVPVVLGTSRNITAKGELDGVVSRSYESKNAFMKESLEEGLKR